MNARTNSTAVMARRIEPADSLDFFPTPPWATRAFCEHVLPHFEVFDPITKLSGLAISAWDPACGEGHMALALEDAFDSVVASDIFDYGFGTVADFLHPELRAPDVDWIVTNPPFNQGPDFVLRALDHARRGVAVLVRMQFLEGEKRLETLFRPTPPAAIYQFAERVPMHRGRWVVNGSTATAYAWVVWRRDATPGTEFHWIPKSRIALSRHDDWLRFSGCEDLPKEHAAMKQQGGYREPVVTLAQVRAEAEAKRAAAAPATIGDVKQAVMARLL